MTPYDQDLYKSQVYDLNASRYNLQNAQAAQAYAAANFYSTMANETAYRNYKQSTGMRPFYPIGDRPTSNAADRPRPDRRPRIPLDQLVGSDGRVNWPNTAPTEPADLSKKRDEVDHSVKDADKEYRKNGRATVADVVAARNRLNDYGHRALDSIREKQPASVRDLAHFLNSLDFALLSMGEAPRPVGSIDLRPDDAPKTAGDVLKDSIKDEKSKDQKPKGESPKGESPKDR